MTKINNISDITTTKKWMTDLWTWADEYGISEKDLPRNEAHLLTITNLTIRSDQISELPESIGYLKNLTHLTLICKALERLPESVGQLSQLEALTATSDKIKQLPDSLVNLEKLQRIGVSIQLINQLPISFIERHRNNELWIENISCTKLYTPQMSEYELSEFCFFLVNDNWDKKALIDLKFEVAPYFLLGLQTTEQTIDDFDVVDGIIICQPNEVQQIMNMFETTFDGFGGIDFADVRDMISFARPARFIQASALEMSKSDQVFNQIIAQIPEDIIIKGMMFKGESNREFRLDEFQIVDDTFSKMGIKDEYAFYNSEVIDKPEHCWMGMIYMVG